MTSESPPPPPFCGCWLTNRYQVAVTRQALTDGLQPCSLALAEQLGADVCLNPQASATPAEVGEWLKASLPPYGPDVVIDCAGFESTLQV